VTADSVVAEIRPVAMAWSIVRRGCRPGSNEGPTDAAAANNAARSGYGQQFLILLTALYLFDVPCQGSISLLMLTTLPFVAVNLAIGLTFSTVAKNQLQAMQMTFFFFLPSILLSGFMFPFYGMPQWAQWLGEVFPLTHFLRIVRGIMLKGNGFPEIWCNLWPILLCLLIVGVLCVKRYRQTLD
jgi:ABC-2 type transport system permease protein